MKHDPYEKLRTIITFLLLDLPERDLIYKYIKMIFIGLLAILATGLAIGYVYGTRDKDDELVNLLTDSVVQNVRLEKDVDALADCVAQQVDKEEELNVIISDLSNDCHAYQVKVNELSDEVAYTRMELYCTNDAIEEYLANAQVTELHEKAQYTLSRKWQARRKATQTTAGNYTSSKSNNDA